MNPKVKRVKALENYRLELVFVNGERRIMDMKPLMYGVFARLEDPDYFRRVRVVSGSVEWPHGQDLSNDTMYLRSKPIRMDKRKLKFISNIDDLLHELESIKEKISDAQKIPRDEVIDMLEDFIDGLAIDQALDEQGDEPLKDWEDIKEDLNIEVDESAVKPPESLYTVKLELIEWIAWLEDEEIISKLIHFKRKL